MRPTSATACTPSGYLDCNGQLQDGCEVDGQTDDQNCGSCGTVCVVGAHVSTNACTSGSCKVTCDSGYGDCDGDPANGCEVNVDTDPSNCGTCGHVCSGGPCVAG